MLVTLAVVTLLYAGASAQPPLPTIPACQPHPVCDLTEMSRCQADFNKQLGLPNDLNVTTYDKLQDQIESLLGQTGINELGIICNAIRSFKFCFTNMPHYASCLLNPLGLVGDENCTATGISEAQARGYVRLFGSLDFACGPGFSHYWNAEEPANGDKGCMSAVFSDKLDDLRKCQTDFDSQLSRDENDVCEYSPESSRCFQRAFNKCGEQGQWFGCQYQLTGLQAAYGNCGQDFCKFVLN